MNENSLMYDYVVKNEAVWKIDNEEYKKLSLAKSLFIPKNVKKISINFYDFNLIRKLHLEKIDVDDNNMYYYSNGSNAIIESKNQKLILGCKNTIIPNKVRVIGEFAFSKCNIKEVLIPDSVILIDIGAFQHCNQLKKIVIGRNVKTIARCAFNSCSRLEYAKISSSVKEICRQSFSNCRNLKNITLEDGIIYIDMESFVKCTSIEKVKIPKSVKEIGSEAFRSCINLKEVIIENGVECIGRGAFSGCASLKQIDIPNSVKSIGNNGLGANCYIGEELTKRFPNLVENTDLSDEEGLTLDEYDLFTYYLKL